MPIEILKDAFVTINAVDLSNHVESVAISYSADVQEATVMGDVGKRRLAGLKDWSAEITFRQDFDDSSVEQTLWPLVGVQTAVRIRPNKTSPISATNPEYQGNGMIAELPLVNGTVGEVHNTSVTITGSDGVPLIRDVTP